MKKLEDRGGFLEAGMPLESGDSLDSGEIRENGDRVMVLPVNEDSRKITQTLSNETSLKILELLGKKSMSATDIAEELKIPLTTVKYNLDSLVDTDLIKVKQIKWSRKGRQVKIYEAMEKLIVLVPSRNPVDKISIISLLQQYIGVIAAAFFAAVGVEYLSMYLKARKVFQATSSLRSGIMESGGVPAPGAIIANDSPKNEANEVEEVEKVDDVAEPELMDVGIESLSEQEVPEEGVPEVILEEESDTFEREVQEEAPLNEEATDEALKSEADPEKVSSIEDSVHEEIPVEKAPVEEPFIEEAPSEETVPEDAAGEILSEEGAEGMEIPETDGLDGLDGLDNLDSLPPVPPEGITHLGSIHGLYDTLFAHPGVWFFFGCLFVVCLLIVREVYYKKKTK